MNIVEKVLDLFKVMVVNDADLSDEMNVDMIDRGLVLNFNPTLDQKAILTNFYQPLEINTLFTREERDNSNVYNLLAKQIVHYIEIYGLDIPGLFNLEVNDGQMVTMNYVRGVTVAELADMVKNLMYGNAPIKNADTVKEIVNHYSILFDIDSILNNEVRVIMFDPNVDLFTSGDDAVRWICREAITKSVNSTLNSSMLIKSPEVIFAVRSMASKISISFLERHEIPLAKVFNRHKKLIMALKNDSNKSVINRISRLSKTKHVPIKESVSKNFVVKALENSICMSVLDQISVRDKFKFLNLLSYKSKQCTEDAFIIRNGKIHLENNRKVWSLQDIVRVEAYIIESLRLNLSGLLGLHEKKIFLDPTVHYGLPISRKQTVGQLPFGTKVELNGGRISSGIYWENSWGARDLDLSTIDINNNRTGWGQFSGYDRNNPITFSGDLTDATNGAMEFMTSKDAEYGLFVNIYNGQVGCETEIVVGKDNNDKKWISEPLIREKTKLDSRNMVVGFVNNSDFIVWQGRIGNNRVSGSGNTPYLSRGFSKFWTVNDLLTCLDIKFDITKDKTKEYDYDLSYDGFSLDKLESLLLK